MPDNYALILAGGSGTRFWPLSRNATPKQLLNLFDEHTLIEQTVKRLEGLVPVENVIVLTNVEQEPAVRKALPQLPAENIVAEPAKRDTAPAIALGIGIIAARDPEAVMMVLPADHLVKDAAAFRSLLGSAAEVAGREAALVTVGIKPTWPCPSYGYIERGERADIPGMQSQAEVFDVKRFREKPNTAQAEDFLNQGNFTWNAGMFIWSIATATTELEAHCPELAAFIHRLRDGGSLETALHTEFPELPKISIDYALMEKASRVLNLEATFDWDDIGSWLSVAGYLDTDADSNHTNCAVSQLDSSGNIVYSREKPHIALLGVKDLIIVQTGDAILVADKNCADSIKKLVDLVPKELH
jgi:mannose-1-phosphate guanylyltransferase